MTEHSGLATTIAIASAMNVILTADGAGDMYLRAGGEKKMVK